MRTNRHARVVLGRSQVHGWGAFALKPVKKGDLVGEYRGELVSQDEADRRGKLYDKLSCSFLFDLDDELVVDAVPATHATYYYVGCAPLAETFVPSTGDAGDVCRAVHKLREAMVRFALPPFRRVVDVGAAPGGWSQVAAKEAGAGCAVIAVDLLPIRPIPNVRTIVGDITLDRTHAIAVSYTHLTLPTKA